MTQQNDFSLAERYGKYALFKSTSASDTSHYFTFPDKYAGSLMNCKHVHITLSGAQTSSLRGYSTNGAITTFYISAASDTIPEEYAQVDLFVPGKGYLRLETGGAVTVTISVIAEVL
jgi:hypothetical protein